MPPESGLPGWLESLPASISRVVMALSSRDTTGKCNSKRNQSSGNLSVYLTLSPLVIKARNPLVIQTTAFSLFASCISPHKKELLPTLDHLDEGLAPCLSPSPKPFLVQEESQKGVNLTSTLLSTEAGPHPVCGFPFGPSKWRRTAGNKRTIPRTSLEDCFLVLCSI